MSKKKLVVISFSVLIFFVVILGGCDTNSLFYNTLSLEMEGKGQILDEDGRVLLDSSDNVKKLNIEANTITEVRAVPYSNWVFVEWENEGYTHTNRSIFMEENKSVKAIFGTLNIYNVNYERNILDYWDFSGTAKNNTGKEIGYVEIHVYLYNENGTRVGHDWTNETDVSAGLEFDWSIMVITDVEFDYYEIKIQDL